MSWNTTMRIVSRSGLALLVLAFGATTRAVAGEACGVLAGEDGRLFITLAGGNSVIAGAYPAISRAGASGTDMPGADGAAPHVSHVASQGPLGVGAETQVVYPGFTWRVTTYPDAPYFTVQLDYTNRGTEPEAIQALLPLVAVDSCTLGAGTNRAPVLDNGVLVTPKATLHTGEKRRIESLWNLAAHDPENGRSLVAGFLTSARAYPLVRIVRNKELEAPAFAAFEAECRYDPPVALAPGETLQSELLYVSAGESSPFDALEHFAHAVAAANDLHPTRRALPHGWDSWVAHYHNKIDEASMLAELDAMDTHLKRYGWTHFSLDDGWQRKAGDWEADPARFPSGMKDFADAVHARGMTAGLWTEPFTVDLETDVARAHPEWLAEPNALGKRLLSDNERILDVTVPGARDFVRDTYGTIARDWGYDALVETDFVYHLLVAESYAAAGATQASALHAGLGAIREGVGPETFIMGVAPFPITAMTADGMRTGIDCAPIWRSNGSTWAWGCVDTLTNAAKRYYLAPEVIALDQDCAFFGHDETRERWKVTEIPKLTRAQQIAWMTGAALTGGALKIGDAFTLLEPDEFDILRRLLPVQPRPARPVDLFERAEPRIFSLPIDAAIGKWHLAGVFNWDETAPVDIALDFAALGLDPGHEMAVFDFWAGEYLGLASGGMTLDIPAGSVRLLCLRPYDGYPMLLSTDSHFTQGATDFTALEWNYEKRVLAGSFAGIENTDYVLSVLVPEGYALRETYLSRGTMKAGTKDRVARLSFHCGAAGPVDWHMQF